MQKQLVLFRDLGKMDYKTAWDLQEDLLRKNVLIKTEQRNNEVQSSDLTVTSFIERPSTTHHLLFVEHSPVYTLGKSGKMENVILGEEQRKKEGIEFFH